MRVRDYTSQSDRVSTEDHWVLGSRYQTPTGFFSPGLTFSGGSAGGLIVPVWGTGNGVPVTFLPVEFPLASSDNPKPRRVLISEIEGVLQDETDTCINATLPTITSLSEFVSNPLAFVSAVVGPLTEYGFQPVTGAFPGSASGTVINTTSNFSSAVCPCGGGFVSGLTIAIYVATWNGVPSAFFPSGSWLVRDLNLGVAEATKEYEFLLSDSYHLPLTNFSVPYTGRSWRLSLRRPIIIGAGQALCVSVSYDTFHSDLVTNGLRIRPAFRTRIRYMQ